MFKYKVVKGVVVAIHKTPKGVSGRVSVVSADGGKPGESVWINPPFHRQPVISASHGSHGIGFHHITTAPKEVKVGDQVFLVVSETKTTVPVAEAWAFADEPIRSWASAEATLLAEMAKRDGVKPRATKYELKRRLRNQGLGPDENPDDVEPELARAFDSKG